MHDTSLFPGFALHRVPTDHGVEILALTAGQGSALLLLHGHPQTHAIWHRVAPVLARTHTVVLADLRGYGDSSKPAGTHDHGNYSKRTLALDMPRLMQALGYTRFSVLAHDRGARVAHRLTVALRHSPWNLTSHPPHHKAEAVRLRASCSGVMQSGRIGS